MLKQLLIICVCLSISVYAHAERNINGSVKYCLSITLKIERVQEKLRHGYKVSFGERLKKKMRKLKKQRYLCHKQGFPTE